MSDGDAFDEFVKKKGAGTYQEAFDAFKQRFLLDKKSIFNLNDDNEDILTEPNIDYLVNNFIENGYLGDASFIEKVQEQLINSPKKVSENDGVKEAAIEILATAVWLWRLTPVNATQSGKISSVKEILDLVGDTAPEQKSAEDQAGNLNDNPFFAKKIKGMASVGTYYNTNKPAELAYLIGFFKECLENEPTIKCLNNVEITVTHNLSKKEFTTDQAKKELKVIEQKKSLWKAEYKEAISEICGKKDKSVKPKYKKAITENSEKKDKPVKLAAIRSALLHWLSPENYPPIISDAQKKAIKDNFDALRDAAEKAGSQVSLDYTPDDDLKGIYHALEIKIKNLWDDKWKEIWDPTILPSKNVIYYGAPGTGKTYQVSELVKRKVGTDTDRFIVQQFHPSFGYEEFIDGIKPKGTDANGNIQFSLVNGEFKGLCIRAFKELVLAKNEDREAKEFYFIADEINRAELSRVFGELLLCLEEDKRLKFDAEGELQGACVKTQNAALWQKEHAVVVLNEDGEPDFENGDNYFFGVPDNLYFLGTMNDIDRSIDSFDLALRRRFKWVRKDCDYDVIAEELLSCEVSDETIVEYLSDGKEKGVSKGRCQLLNSYISDTLNLGNSYELGHSYFMKIEVWNGKISRSAYERLFDSEIGPLVTEYLRAKYPSGKELEDKLKEMRKLFTEGK